MHNSDFQMEWINLFKFGSKLNLIEINKFSNLGITYNLFGPSSLKNNRAHCTKRPNVHVEFNSFIGYSLSFSDITMEFGFLGSVDIL